MADNENKDKLSPDEQVVADHRKMLIVSGNLSDFQLENLKKWPFVIFGKDLKKAEIAYNFKMDTIDEVNAKELEAGSVEFDLYFNKEQEKEYIAASVFYLELWSKFLFWKDTQVTIKIEGKKWEA